MENPYAIYIKCDGAMNYDNKQTGGNGYVIEFPECFNLEPIRKSIRNDGQGIHRLEMISILESMKELISYSAKNNINLNKAASVIINSDRYSVTDDGEINPYHVAQYIKSKWMTKDGKEVKNKDLINDIYKTRKKLSSLVGGRVGIKYIREKYNKEADNLAEIGKEKDIRSKRTYYKNYKKISKRKFNGPEVDYSKLNPKRKLIINVYGSQQIDNNFEISTEIEKGEFLGMKVRLYVNTELEKKLHRSHSYFINVKKITKHHIEIKSCKEKK